jgi:glycosyltransferase involved in cell wall biosynthesis
MLLYPKDRKTTSVIITCHKYELYLEEAIESVLSQNASVDIIVVNDSPADATLCRSITSRYNVKLLEVSFGNPTLSRRAGYEASNGEYVIFLDADDKLGEGYIENAIDVIDRDVVVYSDMQYFGDVNNKTDYAANIDKRIICMTNFMHVGCMIKSKMIKASKVFDRLNVDHEHHEDWHFWRKILLFTGCDVTKQHGLYHARIHANNKSLAVNGLCYFDARGTCADTITFCGMNGKSDFLNNQNWALSQAEEITFNRNHASNANSYKYVPIDDRVDMLNHLARCTVSDYIFFYDSRSEYDRDICENMLRDMDHKHGIVHNTEHELLNCTMISSMLIRDRHYADLHDFGNERIKYVSYS